MPAIREQPYSQPGDQAVAVAVGEARLPIGWEDEALETKKLWKSPLNWLLLLAGYLMTALAATLGGPFWFDMLRRFINIRSALKPMPEKQKEATSAG